MVAKYLDQLGDKNNNYKHGMSGTRIHNIWKNMLARCSNPKASHYRYYGGRGVSVAARWKVFTNFYEDVGDPPSDNHSLDRWPDKDGNYGPTNFRWATKLLQMNNNNRNRFVSYNGKKQSVSDWCRELKLPYELVISRIKLGWEPSRAFKCK